MNFRKFSLALALACLLTSALCQAQAQDDIATSYPSGTVKIIVPYTPGGLTDILGRALAARLEASWGKAVIVENKPGASEAVGATTLARSKPDGLTLFIGSDAAFVVNGFLKKNLTYNPDKDFEPITRLSEGFGVLLVRPDLGIKTLKEFLTLVQKNPGKITFGSEAVGSSSEIRMRILGDESGGYKMSHIPYNGMNPIMSDLLGGRVDSAWMPSHLAKPQIDAQKLVPLAVNVPERTWMFPDIPTLNESGYVNANVTFKMMLSAPAGTPKPIVEKIGRDVRTIMKDPEFYEKSIKPLGQIVIVDTPEQFKEYLKQTKLIVGKVVKEANFNID